MTARRPTTMVLVPVHETPGTGQERRLMAPVSLPCPPWREPGAAHLIRRPDPLTARDLESYTIRFTRDPSRRPHA